MNKNEENNKLKVTTDNCSIKINKTSENYRKQLEKYKLKSKKEEKLPKSLIKRQDKYKP